MPDAVRCIPNDIIHQTIEQIIPSDTRRPIIHARTTEWMIAAKGMKGMNAVAVTNGVVEMNAAATATADMNMPDAD